MIKPYRAVLLDLFNTVVRVNREKLPALEWEGKTLRTTMGGVRPVVERFFPKIPFSLFFTTLLEVSRELDEIRTRGLREVPSLERFRRTLCRLGEADSPKNLAKARYLSRVHMGFLASAVEVPQDYQDLLVFLHQRYRVALVSNFDHASTAYAILRRWGIKSCFDAILISEEFGWRKPHPAIFTAALDQLGVQAREALFVGDSPLEDIGGAKGVFLDAAWIGSDGSGYPAHVASPDFVIASLAGVRGILDGG